MGVKVVQEYERGVVFFLGRYVGIRGPGLPSPTTTTLMPTW
jgi:regulator of protease activity HflC (stomatin/prohibitin superfamily)